MYWDLGPASAIPDAEYRRIASEIAANKILSLQITETGTRLDQPCISVLDTLKEKPLALSLVASLGTLEPQTLGLIRTYPIKVVFALSTSLDDIGAIAAGGTTAEAKPALGISFPVTRDNFQDLPRVLVACIEHRITHLLLPMQRLMTNEPCFSLSKAERNDLTTQLQRIEKPSWLTITIHDPFLWRAFFPVVEFPNGGCQAANTMLYISPEADVYPCPTFPVKIGNLLETPLREIIHSSRKKDLRKSILAHAPECVACGELKQCNGGCRGRAYVKNGSLSMPDPACR
jgi:GeoRSP system SPASM domain protein